MPFSTETAIRATAPVQLGSVDSSDQPIQSKGQDAPEAPALVTLGVVDSDNQVLGTGQDIGTVDSNNDSGGSTAPGT